ncbi:MAG: hypothetical protein HXY50_11850 [Ignavibacteriaceae bacterium]|nr:hypothetical protein [Ignavibacteriaceae bacterium]
MIKNFSWPYIIIILAAIGLSLILYSILFDSTLAMSLGVIVFSLAAIMIGFETIINKKIILRSNYDRRASNTYVGIAAAVQGLIIIVTAVFLIALVIINLLNQGEKLFHILVQRPGVLLIFLSINCFLTGIIIGAGSLEEKQGSKFNVIINLLMSRLLSSLILSIIGFAILILGMVEILNPEYFDSIGGGMLEIIFLGVK